MRIISGRSILALCSASLLLSSCAQKDTHHKIVVSIPDQKMILYKDSHPVGEYAVSTSKFGISDKPGSYATPLGHLEVEKKIGANVPPGGVLKSRRYTGEILRPNAPGRDPIVTRILWLKGLDASNKNAFRRCIYIHGTTEEQKLGRPASYGCVRMRSVDVIQVFDTVGVGARVEIVNTPFPTPPANPATPSVQVAQTTIKPAN